MTSNWHKRMVSITVVLSCLGATGVWAQDKAKQGKPTMLEQQKPLPQQMMQPPQQLLVPPTLTRVVPTAYGYDLIGTGFGTDKNKLQVFEGFTPLAATAVLSISNDKIAVQSKPSGNIQHKVVVAGKDSVMSFTHTSAQDAARAKAEEEAKQKAEAATKAKAEEDAKKKEAEAKAKEAAVSVSPFTSDCGNDGVMVGIKASTGSLVDSVQAVCAKVDSNGAWAGDQFNGTRAGGSGGGPASLMCDEGWAVTAVFGKAGNLVDSIGVRCGKLGASGGTVKIVSGSASRGPAGGAGGGAFDRPCSGAQIAKGISGQAGTLIEQISSVACHNPTAHVAPGLLPLFIATVSTDLHLSRIDWNSTADGYVLVGRGFGTDRSKVVVKMGETTIDQYGSRLASLSDTRIELRYRPSGDFNHMVTVKVADRLSNVVWHSNTPSLPAPVLSGVEQTLQGYTLIGRNLGNRAAVIQVFENDVARPLGFAGDVDGSRVTIYAPLSGAVSHKISVAGQMSNSVSHTHGPILSQVERQTGGGYRLIGRGFGTDRARVQIFEGATQLSASLIDGFSDDFSDGRIRVGSSPSGEVVHKVVVNGVSTAEVRVTHAPAPVIERVEPTDSGYALIGRNFGGGLVTYAFEGPTQLSKAYDDNTRSGTSHAITAITPTRIDVRDFYMEGGTIVHRVMIDGRQGNEYSHTHARTRPLRPTLTGVEITAGGYVLTGREFGTTKLAVSVVETVAGQNGQPIPPSSLISVSDGRIEVNRPDSLFVRNFGVYVNVVDKGRIQQSGQLQVSIPIPQAATSPGPVAPTLSRIESNPSGGYNLVGRGFGTDASRVQVFEGSTQISMAAFSPVIDDLITVRSNPIGTVVHKVVVVGLPSAEVRHTHAAPTLSRIEPNPSIGYNLVGRGFGADASRVQVFEGTTQIPSSSFSPFRDELITVRTNPSGTVVHKVVVGGQPSSELTYAHMPILARVHPTPDGYMLFGRSFGSDASKVQVLEGGTPLPAASVSLTSSGIAVRSRPSGAIVHKVVVGGNPSADLAHTHVPTIARIEPTGDGYALVGLRFGSDASRVQVHEGATQLPASSVGSVSDGRIVVRSHPTGAVVHKVVVGDQASGSLAYTHVAVAPRLTEVARKGAMYMLWGSGFGTDPSRVVVLENDTPVPTERIRSVAVDRIEVTAALGGTVRHKVRVGGLESGDISYTHPAAQ